METLNSLSARSLQYYVIAKKWRSDLEFYKAEIRFLRSLLDGYFFAMTHIGEKGSVAQISSDLMKLEVDKNQLERSLDEQIKQLELMSEDVIPENAASLAGKQIGLENMVSSLLSEYKELKIKIFSLMQKVMSVNRQLGEFSFPN